MGNVVVGSLQVDLIANTAQYTGDLGKAGDSAEEFGRRASSSMREGREGAKLLEEAFGVSVPRGLNTLIVSLGPLGSMFAAAFPIVGAIAAIKIISELVEKHRQAAEEMSKAWDGVDKAGASAMAHVNAQLLRTDEELKNLTGNYLAALKDKFAQIDQSKLEEITSQVDNLSKHAVEAFAKMSVSWTQWLFLAKRDWGSKEASDRLTELQQKVDELNAKGDEKGVGDAIAQALANAQGRLDQLIQKQKTEFTPGTAQAVEAHQKLIPVLQEMAALYGKISEDASKQKEVAQIKFDDASAKRAEEAWNKQQEGLRRYEHALEEFEKHRQKVAVAVAKAAEEEAEAQMKATEAVNQLLAKQNQEEAAEATRHQDVMTQLEIKGEQQRNAALVSMRLMTAQQALNAEAQAEQRLFEMKRNGIQNELSQLDQYDAQYQVKQKQLNNKLEELEKEHNNQMAQITRQGEEQRKQIILQTEQQIEDGFNRSLAQSIVQGKNFAAAMRQTATQVLESFIESALRKMEIDAMTKGSSARVAAANTYAATSAIPLVGPVLAPAAAAAAFAAVSAFEGGGIVPGIGNGDSVPALLEPQEMVLPKPLSQGLKEMIEGGGSKGQSVSVRHSPTYNVQMIDGSGVRNMLEKHNEEFENHFHRTLRRMNK